MARPISEIKAIFDSLRDSLVDASGLLTQVGDIALDRSRDHTPVRSGHLEASERLEVRSSSQAYLEADADYALYVHDGTSHHKAQPFFQEGIDDSVSEADEILKDWGGKAVAKAARS